MGLFRKKALTEEEVEMMLTSYRQDAYIAELMRLQIKASRTPPEHSVELREETWKGMKTIEGILFRQRNGGKTYGPILERIRNKSFMKAQSDFEKNGKDFR